MLTTEGGHVAFAPSDETEIEIWRRLTRKYGRVSVERVLSGSGLYDLYLALADIAGAKPACADPKGVEEAARAGDAVAGQTIDRFCRILGAVAGDIALGLGARGGVYVTGGVAQHLADHIAAGGFRERFEAKGRFDGYMRAIPTYLITDAYTALIGSAQVAGRAGAGMTLEEILTLAPVVPVLTVEEAAHAVPLARALAAGGLKALEVTLRTPAPLRPSSASPARWRTPSPAPAPP